jgi:hypothetical protein
LLLDTLLFLMLIAPQWQAKTHKPQLLQRDSSIIAGSSISNLIIARVLHAWRAWHGKQA